MASKDARQEKRAMPPSEDVWEGLSKYLQQCWDQARSFEYEQTLRNMMGGGQSVNQSDIGNLQIWDGPRRC